MGGARALIASLGASISLVAGAALSLLLISVVVAYPGFVGDDDGPDSSAALVIEDQSPTALRSSEGRSRDASDAVLLRATPRAKAPARAAARPPAVRRTAPAPRKPAFNPGVRDLSPTPPPAADPPPAPPSAKDAVGDGVRDVGDVLTATVKGAGAAAGATTAQLLGPPVSQAVQEVLDLLTSLVQGATGGLAGTLDKTLPGG